MIVDPETVVTPRQLELLALYASGYKIDEIAGMKFLSYSSVKQTLANAKDRVGARNLTHLCVIGMEYGILAPDGRGGYRPVQVEGVVGE